MYVVGNSREAPGSFGNYEDMVIYLVESIRVIYRGYQGWDPHPVL